MTRVPAFYFFTGNISNHVQFILLSILDLFFC
uniref:Uncharacterized protein n=1 Tax=Arundo donax TaxID=35708 RepID=A0A0A8ZA09_ARUDO